MPTSKKPSEPGIAKAQMAAIFRERAEELGSISAVARDIGLSRSFVVKIISDNPKWSRINVGRASIKLVCEKLRVRPEFFGPEGSERSYRDFVEPRGVMPSPKLASVAINLIELGEYEHAIAILETLIRRPV